MATYVVGSDGTDTARRAAVRVGALALAAGASVFVVCAYAEPRTLDAAEPAVGSAFRAAQQVIDDQVEAYRRDGIEAQGVAVEGRPADVLLEQAKRLDAELIAVGNRGMQGLGRLLGSVASGVAHHAPCDVLIVRTV